MTSTNRLLQRHMTSVMDTSMWAPGPPRRAWRMAARAAGAPKTPLAHSVIRPPACTGWTVGAASLRQAPGLGLHGELGGRAALAGEGPPEGGDGQHDQAGHLQQPGLGRTEAGVADHQIGPRHDAGHLRVVEAADDRSLRPGEEPEQGPVVRPEVGPRRRPATERIARWLFDLDDIGTGVGEQLGGVAAGDARRELHDPDVVERSRGHGPFDGRRQAAGPAPTGQRAAGSGVMRLGILLVGLTRCARTDNVWPGGMTGSRSTGSAVGAPTPFSRTEREDTAWHQRRRWPRSSSRSSSGDGGVPTTNGAPSTC